MAGELIGLLRLLRLRDILRATIASNITNPHMDWVKLEIATLKFWEQKTVV
jgi:hypothetical protein